MTKSESWFFWPILVGAFLWCALLVGAHTQTFPHVSPFDEATHFDYVLSLGDLDFPRLGAPYDDEVLREWSCRGTYHEAIVLPRCDSETLDYRDYPNAGIQRNATGPLYYGAVALLIQPARLFTSSTLGIARLTGMFVLFGMALLTVRAARDTGVAGRTISWLTVLAFPAAVPHVLHAVSTVNSDAGVMLLGAAATTAVVSFQKRGYTNPWPLLALAAAAGLTKQTAIFPIVFAAGMLLISRWESWSWPDIRRAAAFPALLGAVAAATLLGWEVLVSAMALPDYVTPIGEGNTIPTEGALYDEFFGVAFDMVPPVVPGWNHASLATVLHKPSMLALQTVAVGSMGWLVASTRAKGRAYGWALILACLAVPLLINSAVYSRFGTYFATMNPRYGLGLLPALWVGVAGFLSSQTGLRRLAVVLAALTVWTGLSSVF